MEPITISRVLAGAAVTVLVVGWATSLGAPSWVSEETIAWLGSRNAVRYAGLGLTMAAVSMLFGLAFAARFRRRDPDQCEHCRYRMRGSTTDRCPECGHRVLGARG